MAAPSGEGSNEGVFGRKLYFCPKLQSFTTEELITTCQDCHQYFLFCCQHTRVTSAGHQTCHHYPLMFTDGACLSNGQGDGTAGARAGLGCAAGVEADLQWSAPVDDTVDGGPGAKRSSQRAELLAAIEGVRRVGEVMEGWGSHGHGARSGHGLRESRKEWVVTMDSEYVVKGMTEWFPEWRASIDPNNEWKSSSGKRPSNLDLFKKLNALVSEQERRWSIKIGFWRVDRRFNQLADSLARDGALRASPAISS